MRRILALAVAILLGTTTLSSVAVRGASFVPFDIQIPLVLKALTYDRHLKSRVSDQVRIAIISPSGKGHDVIEEFNASLEKLPARNVNGLPVTFKEIARADEPLDRELRDGRWAAVYTMPGFNADEIAKIKRAGESARVLLVAAAAEDVERGLAFGVGAEGGRPQIVVNLPSTQACGSDFDLAFLRLGRVIQ
jgi:YfiR/HmsC-like